MTQSQRLLSCGERGYCNGRLALVHDHEPGDYTARLTGQVTCDDKDAIWMTMYRDGSPEPVGEAIIDGWRWPAGDDGC